MVTVFEEYSVNWDNSVTEMRCRLITLEDSEDVLNWRNDLASRQMSKNTSVISLIEHSSWFAGMLNNISHIGLIGEINGEKIGVVFITIRKCDARVSINLNPLHRGKKLAQVLLKFAAGSTKSQFKIRLLQKSKIQIHKHKVFAQNGFTLQSKRVTFCLQCKIKKPGVS